MASNTISPPHTLDHPRTKEEDGQSLPHTSDDEQEMTYPEGGLRAWIVVAGSAATMFCTFGYLTGFGIYQNWYVAHQLSDRTQSDISWIGSFQIFLNFSIGLIGGPLMDRYGTVAFIPSAIVYVVSLVLTSLCKEYYQFFLAQAVLGGICLGLLFNISLAIIGHYFVRRQGLASGIIMAGAALGGVIFPVALDQMLNHRGLSFGWAVRICALIILVLLGLAAPTMRTRLPPTRQRMDFTLMRRPAYILIAAGGWMLNWGMYVPLFYLPSFSESAGMDAKMAPYTVAIFNAVSLFGRVLSGTLADGLGRLNVVVLNGLLCAIMQFVWPATNSTAGVYCVSVFSGLFIGSIVSLQAAIVAQVTPDPKYIGSMMGITMAIWACGGLTGPPIAGAILNSYGSFDGPAYFAGASLVVGSLGFLAARLITEPRIFVKI